MLIHREREVCWKREVKREDMKREASHFVGDPLKWARWLGTVGSFRQNELVGKRVRLAILREWRGFRVAQGGIRWLRSGELVVCGLLLVVAESRRGNVQRPKRR